MILLNNLKSVVLDVLKPHEPDILKLGREILSKESSIESLEISVLEIDRETETLKIVVNGKNVNFDKLRKRIEKLGAVVHSIDAAVLKKTKN